MKHSSSRFLQNTDSIPARPSTPSNTAKTPKQLTPPKHNFPVPEGWPQKDSACEHLMLTVPKSACYRRECRSGRGTDRQAPGFREQNKIPFSPCGHMLG